jgi:hypothetical protein
MYGLLPPRLGAPQGEPVTFNRDSPQGHGLLGWWSTLHAPGLLVEGMRGERGTPVNTPVGVTSPVTGYGLSFNGSNQSATITSPLSGATSFTVAFWVAPQSPSPGTFGMLVGTDTAYNGGFFFGYDDDAQNPALGLQFFIGGTKVGAGATRLTNQVWQHLAVTYESGVHQDIWINGVLTDAGSSSSGSIASHTLLRVGGNATNGFYAAAHLADVRVYDHALSATELWQIYNPATRWELYQPPRRLWPSSPSNASTGTAAITLPHLTETATGTFKSASTGTAAITLPHLTVSAAGDFIYTGTAAITLPHLTETATGTFVSDSVGTAAITLPPLTANATGDFIYTGTAAITLPHLTESVTGTFTAAGVFAATAAITLPHLTETATGTFKSASVGTAAITLPHLTTTGTGTFTSSSTGTAAITLPHLTVTASGTVTAPAGTVTGTVAITLPHLTTTSAGTFKSSSAGVGVVILPHLVTAGAGTFRSHSAGVGVITLPHLVVSIFETAPPSLIPPLKAILLNDGNNQAILLNDGNNVVELIYD